MLNRRSLVPAVVGLAMVAGCTPPTLSSAPNPMSPPLPVAPTPSAVVSQSETHDASAHSSAVATSPVAPASSSVIPPGGATGTVTAVVSGAEQRWSNPATWGGKLPAAGADVVIPAGSAVVLDGQPAPVGQLSVDGGLRIADVALELQAESIHVAGAFQAGTAEAPLRNDVTITLTGGPKSPEDQHSGRNAFAVMGGTLDLHGDAPDVVYTRLAKTAPAGATTLQFVDAPDWEVGQTVVVATTDFRREQTEERVLTEVSGATVTLDRPLQYSHYGDLQKFGEFTLDERAHVAVKDRNVVVRGTEEAAAAKAAGHVMIMAGSTARVEGSRFTGLGQPELTGRYSLHFHLGGDMAGSYVRSSTVDGSHNRGIIVHGTNNLVVEKNFTFDIDGHAFGVEDGTETGNQFLGNLGITTNNPEVPLADGHKKVSTFWINAPQNVFDGNVAVGSQESGFWFDDSKVPFTSFKDNISYSNHFGMFFDRYYTRDVLDFHGFVAFKNRGMGFWGTSRQRLQGGILADNPVGMAVAQGQIHNSLVVGISANNGGSSIYEFNHPRYVERKRVKGLGFYFQNMTSKNTTFANFEYSKEHPNAAFTMLNETGQLGRENEAEGSAFINAQPLFYTGYENADSAFLDLDGSVSGTGEKSWIYETKHPDLTADCKLRPTWNAYVCPFTE